MVLFLINQTAPGAGALENMLLQQLHISGRDSIPVIKTVAIEGSGVDALLEFLKQPKQWFR